VIQCFLAAASGRVAEILVAHQLYRTSSLSDALTHVQGSIQQVHSSQ